MKVIDMHCDTIGKLMEYNSAPALKTNKLSVDIDKLISGDYMLQNFAMFVNMKNHKDCFERCVEMLDFWKMQQKRCGTYIKEIRCSGDVKKNIEEGKISALLSVEEGECCGGNFEKLDCLYDIGVRMMTITWNYENSLGYPATPRCVKSGRSLVADRTKGLTEKGRTIVSYMVYKGMMIDVSHLSDKGFYDVCDIATNMKKPFVASHSNAREIAGNARNLTDDMLKKIGETGGVAGINFYPPFLSDKKISKAEQLQCLILHLRHMINKGGIGCVGIGTDFDGIEGELAISDASKMQVFYDALRRAGFLEVEIEHIFWKNVMRVYKSVLG